MSVTQGTSSGGANSTSDGSGPLCEVSSWRDQKARCSRSQLSNSGSLISSPSRNSACPGNRCATDESSSASTATSLSDSVTVVRSASSTSPIGASARRRADSVWRRLAAPSRSPRSLHSLYCNQRLSRLPPGATANIASTARAFFEVMVTRDPSVRRKSNGPMTFSCNPRVL